MNVEGIMKSFDDEDFSRELEEYVDIWTDKSETESEIVRSEGYKQWIYQNIVSSMYDDEFLYNQDNPNRENAQLLCRFYDYIDSLYKELNPPISYIDMKEILDDGNCNFLLNFKIKDNYFSIQTVWGQGSMTTVTRLDKQPSHYVNI